MNTDRNNRIKGILYGVAVGDALGAPLEFMDAAEIRAKYGTVREMIGGGWLDVEPGEVTDDTQMTLAVAEGIVEAPDAPIMAIGQRFIAWYNSRPKDIGGTCASSILNAVHITRNVPTPEEWYLAAYRTHAFTGMKSAGNGSLMRTAYPAMYYPDLYTATNIACEISRMTHFDTRATHICNIYTGMLNRVIADPDPSTRLAYIAQEASGNGFGSAMTEQFTPRPTGFVVDSFEAALHCLMTTDSFEEAVVKAVNLGGDADTIGAITGGLAGALYGYEDIPVRWTKCLDAKTTAQIDRLNAIAVAQWGN